MSATLDALRATLAGRELVDGALLQSCRFEGLGTAAFGREPILATLRRCRLNLSPTPRSVEATASVALFDEADDGTPFALFADRFGEAVGRLWCLTDAEPIMAAVPAVSVASDVDMDQRGAGVFMETSDHPDLSAGDADRVRGIAARVAADLLDGSLVTQDTRLLRARVFVRRAFSDARGGAALLGVDAAAADPVRRPLSFNVGIMFDSAGPERVVVDLAGLRASLNAEWTPRLQPSDGCADLTA